MKYFFWNTNNKEDINKYIVDLVKENRYNFIALAEYKDNIGELIRELKRYNINMIDISTKGCKRINIITNISRNNIIHLGEVEYFTKKAIIVGNKAYIISVVHLPSKLRSDDGARANVLQTLIEQLKEDEEKYKTKDSIIMGDFNANPYEPCMVSTLGLHSIPSLSDTKKLKRKLNFKEYDLFYNPMWNKFGDFNAPPGTYYYDKESSYQTYWNIFDQVIIRPQVADIFVNESLNIVIKGDEFQLFENNKIKIGDHLPIEFEIKDRRCIE